MPQVETGDYFQTKSTASASSERKASVSPTHSERDRSEETFEADWDGAERDKDDEAARDEDANCSNREFDVMRYDHIPEGVTDKFWTSQEIEEVEMRYNTVPLQLASLIHDLAVHFTKRCIVADCTDRTYRSHKYLLDQARNIERANLGANRRYDESLRVTNGYSDRKRNLMKDMGYGENPS